MLDRRERILAAGQLAVVVHDGGDRVRRGLLHGLEVPGPVFLDRDKVLYRAFGLGRHSILRFVRKPDWVLKIPGQVRDLGGRAPTGRDVLQLGGDFVLDADLVVRFAHASADQTDRAPTGVLVRELERAGGSGST